MLNHAFQMGLGGVPFLAEARTRSICAENPKGEKSGGVRAKPEAPDSAKAAAMLGEGWKVRACITLPSGETTTLADIGGARVIRHLWITVREAAYRDSILRMYWDG